MDRLTSLRLPFSACVCVTLGFTSLLPRTSGAHIDLESPSPRAAGRSPDPNANLKEGPCGQVDNGRTQNVNVFAPGETIEVTWREYVNHRSYYRVAFDPDGDDAFPIFPGPGTSAEGHDPTRHCPVDGNVILAYELADGVADEHSLQVTLPDVECESCTLQLIQYMYDTGRPYYYQCADLALRRGDAGTRDAASTPDPPPEYASFRAADSCSAELPPRPRRSDMSPPRVTSPEAMSTDLDGGRPDAGPSTANAAPPGSSGCALSRGLSVRPPHAAFGALLLVLFQRRRRGTAASATPGK